MPIVPTEFDLRWLAKQRPHNKRQNRILLLNAKKRILRSNERPFNNSDDTDILTQHEVMHHAN